MRRGRARSGQKEAEKAAVAEAKAAAKAEREAERQAKLDEKEAVKAAKEEERVRVAEEKAAAERAEAEAAEAARVEEARCPIELQGWRIEGHALVGKRLAFYGNGGGEAEEVYTLGRVVRWMEGKEDGNGGGRASRFHVFYDNGMEGEVTEAAARQVMICLRALRMMWSIPRGLRHYPIWYSQSIPTILFVRGYVSSPPTLASEGVRMELRELEEGLCQGMKQAGSKWEVKKHKLRTTWLKELAEGGEVSDFATLAMGLESQLYSLQVAEDVVERKPWRMEGHEWLGRSVRRFFWLSGEDKWVVLTGICTSWLPAEGFDCALWHIKHEDGDEEDLDEMEIRTALGNYAEDKVEPLASEAKVLKKQAKEAAKKAKEEMEAEMEGEGEGGEGGGEGGDGVSKEKEKDKTLWRSEEGEADG